MKHCTTCNLDYPDDKNFCRQCGAPLADAAPSAPAASETRRKPHADQTAAKKGSAWNLVRAALLVVSATILGLALLNGLGMLLGMIAGGALASHLYLRDDT